VTTATPTRADELEDLLSDRDKATKLVQDGTLATVVQEYAAEWVKTNPDARRQIAEESQKQIADLLRENGVTTERLDLRAVAAATTASKRGTLYSDEAPGAKLDAAHQFKNGADFLRTVHHGNVQAEAVALRNRIRNEFSSETGADGGFLVPETMRSTLMEVALGASLTRPRAMVLPMPSKTLGLPIVEDTNHSGSLFGGLVAYWAEEGASVTETSAKFGVTKLEAKKLMAKSLVPNELFADAAIALDAWIRQAWGKAMAWYEDIAFVNGNGVGEPLGWNTTNNGALVSVTKQTNQTADTIVWENIVKMYARMLPSSLGSAVWIANIDTLPELSTMGLVVGTGGGPVWQTNGVMGPPMTLMGRPIIFTEHMETIGDAGDIAFVDLSYYVIGDRQAMSIATSEHADWDTDKTNFRIIQRLDGRPWLKNAITPRKGANTLSPFVRLAARA
jgi:HK97 family phage major capsid protein